MKAAVLGAGSWGTTFAQVLCDAGTPVTLWARRPDIAEAVNGIHENPRYLPEITLPSDADRDRGRRPPRSTARTWWCSRSPRRRSGRA